ncbi:HK97 gp10 family phage protein [Ligilactobacillus cholophilus]|uniref:HK97 gp10 family phage protein n=1 Tax=Ligilactobacillus cholophilus TaxID=3050131 RepID=UPI0025B25C40|nr:HK97 gp10 family phage protein [Ligilactobacillus cholophilus]
MANDETLSSQLQDYINQLQDVADLSTDEQAKVTKAGAEEFAKELKKVTPVSDRNTKHAKDTIIVQNTDIDGNKNGDSVVGYDSEHAYIMRMMNDGTKYYPKKKGKKFGKNHLNFYSKLFANNAVQTRVLNANARALEELIKSKQGG